MNQPSFSPSDAALTSETLTRARRGALVLLGFGISNRALLSFLLPYNRNVIVYDAKGPEELGQAAQDAIAQGVRFVHEQASLPTEGVSVVFRSPGIRPDLPCIRAAVARGAQLSSEMELFFELTPANIFAITGSDGKTTTTTLTSLFLKERFREDPSRRVYVGGNIGQPLLPHVGEMTDRDYAIVELSSFQLMTLTRGAARAAVTNVSPNHLNWHHGMEEYIRAKQNAFCHAPTVRLVVNAENEITRNFGQTFSGQTVYFSSKRAGLREIAGERREHVSALYLQDDAIVLEDASHTERLLDVADIRLPGVHNIENYMTAMALTLPDARPEDFRAVAASFTGVPHRLEPLGERHGVHYINSSIDSSPSRTAAALSVFHERVIVICGGRDKAVPLAPLAATLCAHAKAVVLTGEAAPKIRRAILDSPDYHPGLFALLECPDFGGAVRAAAAAATPGDTVILSPACTSYDAFRNFEERGNAFRDIVRTL